MPVTTRQIDNIRSLNRQAQTIPQIAAAVGTDVGDVVSVLQGGLVTAAGEIPEALAATSTAAPAQAVDWSKAQGFQAPRGHVQAPTLPASAATATNKSNRDALVTVTGGTVTVIAVGGTPTGATTGTVVVGSGQTIAITYSAAPTWSWVLL